MQYISCISNRPILPERYIVELVCINLAEIKKIKLTEGFWNETDLAGTNWKSFYSFQIRIAYQLTKIYSASSVIKALNDKSIKIYTLRDKRLDPLAKYYYDIETSEKKKIETKEASTFGQKTSTPRSKLKDL